MALDLPPVFRCCDEGQRISLVASLQCWDSNHDAHLLISKHEGAKFHLTGLLEGIGSTFSLVNAQFRKQFPLPWLVLDEQSHVFRHDPPSWHTIHEVIELCSGFGGMHQGMSAVGFRPVAAVDMNERMLGLYGMQCGAERIVGDVTQVDTLVKLWSVSKGAGTLAAGFACQPYSMLGDQRGEMDPRSSCLTGVLSIAFLLQVQAVVLECVQPAAGNVFVQSEIQRFLDATGYSLSQCDLRLDDIWPARRNRAWWLITSSFIGSIPLTAWPRMQVVTKVRQLIPLVQPWDSKDEDDLSLNEIEKKAFGVENDSFCRYLLNFESVAPCALHSWGSQVVGCSCGCGKFGLSEHRLKEKGLFGCLLQSCPTEMKPMVLRHAHPNEVMMMCGFDPMIDFGPSPRLTLSAAGQMASPLQAAWVFSALEERLQQIRGVPTQFNAQAQIQAFVTWILMRGRQVWPAKEEPIVDSNTVALIEFWSEVSHLSMPELISPLRWPDLHPCTVSVASVLDLLIRKHQMTQVPRVFSCQDVAMTALDDDACDEPTPWFEPPVETHGTSEVVAPHDLCVVVFHHEASLPVEFRVTEGETVQRLICAHAQLTGHFLVETVRDQFGHDLRDEHVLQAGQVVHINCAAVRKEPLTQTAQLPCESQSMSVAPKLNETHQRCEDPAAFVSPTLPWTFPANEPAMTEHEGSFGPFDAGECEVPKEVMPDCESWISAAPLWGLKDKQFLKLNPPAVQGTKHLWALRHQFLKSEDRAAILHAQDVVWSDDEFRYHIGILLNLRNAQRFDTVASPEKKCMMLDPLLLTGWVQHGTGLCHGWAKDHPEILAEGIIILSACVVAGHWIPVVLTPNGKTLLFTTWDLPSHAHDDLNVVIEKIGKLLGFDQVTILRHQRLFFMSDKCGALAMAFLHHSVFNSMLPANNDDADLVHCRLREAYRQEVVRCQIARRPWIWGAGDADPYEFPNEPGQASSADPAGTVPRLDTCFSHQCIDKEARLDLLRQKGKMWGDDEIRFHLQHMMNHPRNVANSSFSGIPGFVMMDPLLLTTWDSIGPTMCESWCRRNQVVQEKGFHIVAIFLHEEHWFPIWIVPHGKVLVAHVIRDEVIDHVVVVPLLEVLRVQFGFQEMVLNTHPNRLPDHSLCGAAAIAFLGHIMVSADLPDSLEALLDLHPNMKASFVHALFEGKCCICPVAWGLGGHQAVVKQLSAELVKHGVPEDVVEQRAQQAVKALGLEQVHQALQTKNVWRSLKALGNNHKFQFLMPAELEAVVAQNKSLPVGRRKKNNVPVPRPALPEMVDPSKLALPGKVFHAAGHDVPQIAVNQLGPLAHGVALISLEESLPYLKAGKLVSKDPLALAVFCPPGHEVETVLPHTRVTIPCVCIANKEPLLTEVTVVQLGEGFIEKQAVDSTISLDQLDVVTVKVMVYRDECTMSWEEFVSSPIKHLVRIFPVLTRCHTADCTCDSWHNTEQLPLKDPIMDVWRRQFLRSGFRPVVASKAEMFSVCLRVPAAILPVLLSMSGASGAYTEPRTPDGKEVLAEFSVVWAPKVELRDLAHIRQTNPAAIGLARLGERRGLRVKADQAQVIHQVLRPETAFLPGGPRSQFLAGPFPWGVDRHAICKAMKQAGWEVKALQPSHPVVGRGSMWLLQSVEAPPQLIFHMAHGEVVVSKHRQQDNAPKHVVAPSVGSASTLNLCSPGQASVETDPWTASDPWGGYNKQRNGPAVTSASEGLQQLEERISSAVLAKIPQSMESDDVPERMSCLENQVKQLMNKHQVLEGQFTEFSAQSGKQFAIVQQQIQQQGQTFHGQLESQTQSVQAMFETQMQQIRNLLSKRPRDEAPME